MRIVCARASRFAPAKGSTVTVAVRRVRQGFDRGVRTHNDDHFLCNHDSFNGHPIRPVAGVECVSRVATLSSNASSSSSSATSHELIASRQPRQHANVALRRYVTGYRTAPRSNCWRRAGISRVRGCYLRPEPTNAPRQSFKAPWSSTSNEVLYCLGISTDLAGEDSIGPVVFN